MKLILLTCLLLAPVFSAGAVTLQSEKVHDWEARIMRAQQTTQTRLLISGFLFVGPAVKKTPADTSSRPQVTANPAPAPAPLENTTSLPLNGSSGARAQ
jgi:hypothetical protein